MRVYNADTPGAFVDVHVDEQKRATLGQIWRADTHQPGKAEMWHASRPGRRSPVLSFRSRAEAEAWLVSGE